MVANLSTCKTLKKIFVLLLIYFIFGTAQNIKGPVSHGRSGHDDFIDNITLLNEQEPGGYRKRSRS